MRRVLVAAGLAAGLAAAAGEAGAGCTTRECDNNVDCPLGTDCSLEGRCVPSGQGRVTWLSPAPGSEVGPLYDAVIEVSFRGAAATLHVDRAARDGGDPCTPFVPRAIVVPGATTDVLVQKVTVPGLPSLGTDFKVVATLGQGTDNAVVTELHGPPGTFGGAAVTSPDSHEVSASGALTVPLRATLDRASTVFAWTEPAVGPPTPRALVGAGLVDVDTAVPLVRGPQILWIESDPDDGGDPRLCGFGLDGTPAPDDATTGLELGLAYAGDDAGELTLRARIRRSEPVVCSYADPGESCEALFQSRGPSTAGAEGIHVDTADADVIDVLVVPAAAGPPLEAMVRVSFNGEHQGFFGPISVNPGNGESWLAGTIAVRGALVDLHEQNELVTGPAPF